MPPPQDDVQRILHQLEQTEREIQLLTALPPQPSTKIQYRLFSGAEKVKPFLLKHSVQIARNPDSLKKKYINSYAKWVGQMGPNTPDCHQATQAISAHSHNRLPKQYRSLKFDLSDSLAQNSTPFCKKWSEHDRKLFVHQYLAFPKRFHKIAHNLSLKTNEDCVLYYYQRKKQLHLKQKLISRQVYMPSRTHYLGEK